MCCIVAGKISDGILNLKKEVVSFLSQHMAASNLATDEGSVTFTFTLHFWYLPHL